MFRIPSLLFLIFCLAYLSSESAAYAESKRLMPKNICGIKGGKNRGDEWCWHVSFYNSKNEYFCNGALIGTQWVLTSAYCLGKLGSDERFTVALGKNRFSLSRSMRQYYTLHYTVDVVYIHPKSNRYENYNIALVKLDGSVKLANGVCTVCLPPKKFNISKASDCVVTWPEYKQVYNMYHKMDIKSSSTKMISNENCMKAINVPSGGKYKLPTDNFCTDDNRRKNIIWGNSGAPLACQNNGVFELAGLGSIGNVFATEGTPGVFTNVSSFISWIHEVICNEALVCDL